MRWKHKCDRHPSPGGALVRTDGQWRSFGDWFSACPFCREPNPYYKPKQTDAERVAALTAELAEAREQLRQSQEIIDGFRAQSLRYKASMDECERLREALTYYAENKHWYEGLACMGSQVNLRDYGQVAQAALSASGR